MRKLNLRPYPISARQPDGSIDTRPFNVRESCIELCFIPVEGCKKGELLQRDKLAHKILAALDDDVLLEEAEWARLNEALDHVRALGRNEAELVRRITEAPQVSVQETGTPD